MRQILHLFIVNREQTAALATHHQSRWVLPIVSCDERTRAPAAVRQWLVERGLISEVVGQWLGRLAADATDWLAVARAAPDDIVAPVPLEWIPFPRFVAEAALIEYQGWSVNRSLEQIGRPMVPGPFGDVTWCSDVTDWIRASTGKTPRGLTAYRAGAHEVVLGVDSDWGRSYFKGLTGERANEARLTQTLAALVPGSFAPTLTLEERPDGAIWWLTSECTGTASADVSVVARALARLQRRVMASAPMHRTVPRADLGAAVRWATELVDENERGSVISGSHKRVADAAVPESWIPMDLHPSNVLVDRGGVRLIDLDDSFLGPVPLAMALFARRCSDRSALGAYEKSWSPALSQVDWRAFEIVASVFESWLGWQRVNRNVQRGEVHGSLSLVEERIRQRLARLIADGSR